jgi:hypothetical protein
VNRHQSQEKHWDMRHQNEAGKSGSYLFALRLGGTNNWVKEFAVFHEDIMYDANPLAHYGDVAYIPVPVSALCLAEGDVDKRCKSVVLGPPKDGEVGQMPTVYEDKWTAVSGTLAYEGGTLIGIAASTAAGDCCAPYFDRLGRMVGSHRIARVRFERGFFPAADIMDNPRPTRERQWCLTTKSSMEGLTYLDWERATRKDELKVVPLRHTNPVLGVEHVVLTPTPPMVRAEVSKFEVEPEVNAEKSSVCAAFAHVAYTDKARAFTAFREPSVDVLVEVLREGLDMTASAGHGRGRQGEELKLLGASLGADDEASMEAGLRRLAVDTLERFHLLLKGELQHYTWTVFGKKDKYKLKKLNARPMPDTRSIQGPPMELKALYLLCYQKNDAAWTACCDEYEPGENPAEPLRQEFLEAIVQSVAADATDVTGWDRSVPALFLEMYFMYYMKMLDPMLPEAVNRFMFEECSETLMVLPDGQRVWKDGGMPSGWPNTIRVNSVINRVVSYILALERAKDEGRHVSCDEIDGGVFARFCGDDQFRLLGPGFEWAADDRYYELAAEIFPAWKIKREGHVRRVDCEGLRDYILRIPTFVSRTLVPMHGLVWRVPFDLPRTFANFLHQDRDEDKELFESKKMGTEVCALHLLVWHRDGLLESEYLDRYIEQFPPSYMELDRLYDGLYTLGNLRLCGDEEGEKQVRAAWLEAAKRLL